MDRKFVLYKAGSLTAACDFMQLWTKSCPLVLCVWQWLLITHTHTQTNTTHTYTFSASYLLRYLCV